MKKFPMYKCFMFLGLLLFLTLLTPLAPFDMKTASATEIGKEKNDYRLNLKSVTLVKGKSFSLKAYNLTEQC